MSDWQRLRERLGCAAVRRSIICAGLVLALQTPQADDAREAVADLRERQYQQGLEIGCSLRVITALRAQDETALSELQQGCRPATRSDAVATG